MHNAVRSKFQTDLVTAGHVATVVYDNERESVPADAAWVECQVADIDTELAAHGGQQRFRKRGELRATIRRPLGRGDAESLRVGDAIRSSFNRAIASDVHYGATSLGAFQRREQYWESLAVTPFYHDDVVTRADDVGSWSLVDRETAFNAIRARFNSLFGSSGTVSSNTVIYDNDPTKPPSDTQWINFSITTGNTEEIGAGVNAWARTFGIATAMIMSPLGVGDRDALVLGDSIVQRFRSLTDNSVAYETPYLLSVGRRGQWFQTNATIRFRLEEVLP